MLPSESGSGIGHRYGAVGVVIGCIAGAVIGFGAGIGFAFLSILLAHMEGQFRKSVSRLQKKCRRPDKK